MIVLLLLSQTVLAQQGPGRPFTPVSKPGGHSLIAPTPSPVRVVSFTDEAVVEELPQDSYQNESSPGSPNRSPMIVPRDPSGLQFSQPLPRTPVPAAVPPPVPPAPQNFLQQPVLQQALPQQPFLQQPISPPFQPSFAAPDLSQNFSGPAVANDRRWSFNFQNAPWITVLRSFAREGGFALQIAAEPEGEFTYFDENLYTVTETIDLLNDYLLSTGRILVRDGNRLTLTNATGDIPSNLIPFVPIHQIDSLGRNELASVAIPLRNTDPNLAVQEIQQLQSQLGQVKALTNSGRVIVTDTGSYLRRMRDLLLGSGVAAGDGQAYVYQLRHAQAEDVAKAITDFLGQSGGAVSADGGMMGGGSSDSSQRVVAEKTTNSLLVRGSTEEMGTIQRIIDELDRAPREVLVQALLVEVELGNTHELGVELGFQDSVLFDRSVVDNLVTVAQTTTAPNGTQTTNQTIVSQTAAPGFNFNTPTLGNNIAANPSRVGAQSLSNFGVGRVNGDLGFGGLVLSAGSESVNVLLRALDAHFNIDVLSRPQVRAIENHEAFIQIGQQVPVVDGVAITPVGSANPVIRQDQAGIILKVTPRISPDGRVQLDVNAEKSAFNLTPGTGVPIFTDATNGNVIEAPIKDITTADTTVSIQSGQTIVLGGMITNDQTSVIRKVPWLGDIPLVGRLFRYDLNRHRRKELLVFLTPTVIEGEGHAEYLKSHEVELIHMPAEAFSFGDNLTGTYSGGMESQFVAPPIMGQNKSSVGKDGLFPESSSNVRPASRTNGGPAPRTYVPSAGHSGSLKQVSGTQSNGIRRASFQNGNEDNTGAGVRPAGYEVPQYDATQYEVPESAEPPKPKSLWGRSPNFRGFVRSKPETKAPAPSGQWPPATSRNGTEPTRAFPQPQLSPEVLQYQQSRNATPRRR